MSEIQTIREHFPDLTLEGIQDSTSTSGLRLHARNKEGIFTSVNTIEHGGVTYAPRELPQITRDLVRFPGPSTPFGSTADLIHSLKEYFTQYAYLRPEALVVLVAFAMGSWFCSGMPVAPLLFLSGPDAEVSNVSRLLNTVCYHPVLLGDIDLPTLKSMLTGLGATLLVNQKRLAKPVRKVLCASSRRHFSILRGAASLDLYGPRVFVGGAISGDPHGLRVVLSPARDPLPILSDIEEQRAAQTLQSKLLAYSMTHRQQVQDALIDCSGIEPDMREQARSWLAPICSCPEFTQEVLEEILRQGGAAGATRLIDPTCVVIEAALFFCHQSETKHFFVGELAKKANDILEGRHEKPSLLDRKAGSTLRGLGLVPDPRKTQGYKIVLTDAVRERIHLLARDFQVASLDDGVRRCRFCSKSKARSSKRPKQA